MERLFEYLMIYSIRTALLALFSLCFSGSYLQQGYGSSMHSNLRMYHISGGICVACVFVCRVDMCVYCHEMRSWFVESPNHVCVLIPVEVSKEHSLFCSNGRAAQHKS